MLGLGSGPSLLTLVDVESPRPGRPTQELVLQAIDPISGAIGDAVTMRPPPNPVGQLWPMSVLLAVSVTAALLFIVFRGTSQAGIDLPEGSAAASPLTRLSALAIDLVPGAVIAMILFAPSPADLVRSPVFSLRFGDAAAFMVMVSITTVLSTISDLLMGRTPGKRLVGLQVVSQGGDRVTAGRS